MLARSSRKKHQMVKRMFMDFLEVWVISRISMKPVDIEKVIGQPMGHEVANVKCWISLFEIECSFPSPTTGDEYTVWYIRYMVLYTLNIVFYKQSSKSYMIDGFQLEVPSIFL